MNISEFDGRILKLREDKIRESALILAGECIALLLHNLSKYQDFLDKSMQQTQGWWHKTTQKHGYKKRQILTVGNVEVTLKLPYVVERQNQPNKNIKQEGFCPFLKWYRITLKLCYIFALLWIAGSWDSFCDSIFNSFIKPRNA